MDSIDIKDAAGATKKMATREGPSNIHRPVHHSEPIHLLSALTRPANTTAYAAGDVIGTASVTVFEFDIGALGIDAAVIVGARLIRDSTGSPANRFRGMVFDAAPTSPPAADNDAALITWANRDKRRGYVDFLTSIVGSDCVEWSGVLSNVQGLVVAPADGIVRVMLTTLDALTPASGTTTAIDLMLVV